MICLIALVVAGFLGIFSVSYRRIAIDAFNCVFRNITFRRCTSGTDIKLKSHITGSLLKRSPRTARFVRRNFEWISWLFTLLLVGSVIYSGISIYNLHAYGNCNGQNSQEECILTLDNPEEIPAHCTGKVICEDCSMEQCGTECECEEGKSCTNE